MMHACSSKPTDYIFLDFLAFMYIKHSMLQVVWKGKKKEWETEVEEGSRGNLHMIRR